MGNIGYRSAKILKEIESRNIKAYVFARKAIGYSNLNINVYEFISRALNFIRIYVIRRFNHRKIDDFIFQLLEKKLARKKIIRLRDKPIVHIWGPYIDLMKYYKNNGYKIILDVPIAFNLHAVEIFKDTRYDISRQTDIKDYSNQEQVALNLADKIIVPSNFVADGIIKNYSVPLSKLEIIPFGVEYKKFYVNRRYKKNGDGLKFIFTGALNQRKGIFDLLEAWNSELFKNDTLILCGRAFPEIINKSQKITKGGTIQITGHVDITNFLREADIFVFPTYMEGSAKSVYEALAAGLPVLTTKNAGSIIQNNKTGILIDPGNIDILRKEMFELKMNYSLREEIGFEGQRSVIDYSWERYAAKVSNLYHDMHSGNMDA